MGFNTKDKPTKSQVSLNGFLGDVKDDLKGAGSVIKENAKAVGRGVAGAFQDKNKDLKHRMQHRSGRAIDDN